MVHGATKTKCDKTARRISPNKDRTKKKAVTYIEKKNSSLTNKTEKISNIPKEPCLDENEVDELLTPEFILKTYANKKNTDNVSIPKRSTSLDDLTATKDTTHQPTKDEKIGILELLSKRDTLEKLANSVSQAVEVDKERRRSNSIQIMELPVKPSKTQKSPPSTPLKKSVSERFAGLSNSPSPNNLPLPSFSIFDQELNKEIEKEKIQPNLTIGYQMDPRPLSAPSQSHSPPSNSHLESMTSQLRIMLNIAPIKS